MLLLVPGLICLGPTVLKVMRPYPSQPKHTLQVNALEMVGHIYSVVFAYQFSPQNHVIGGLGYQNQQSDFGITHAPSVLIGYRRFIWRGLYAEYTFWPAYNWYYEKNEARYYNGFELWGEFRAGYDVNFKWGTINWFMAPQFILGKGIIEGNKPESFTEYYKHSEPWFIAGNIALGIKF